MTDPEQTTEISRLDAPYKAAPLATEDAASVATASWLQMVEVAKLMARAGIALPPHARENPSVCWAIIMQTREWNLSNPFFTAQHSYVVRSKEGVETLAYDSAVFQAVLLASKAIIGRPQYLYEGEDDNRRCTVQVMDAQTKEWQELRTPPLAKCRARSPLWVSNPDQQLAYFGLRNLVRLKYQDVLGGFYDKDEFEDTKAEPPPSTSLIERLKENNDPEAKKRAHGEAIKEGRRKAREARAASVSALPQFQAPQGFGKDIEVGVGTVPEPAPAATADPPRAFVDLKDNGPLIPTIGPRGIPATEAEYIEYATGKINAGGWGAYDSPPQRHLREMCKVTDLSDKMLRVLIEERAK